MAQNPKRKPSPRMSIRWMDLADVSAVANDPTFDALLIREMQTTRAHEEARLVVVKAEYSVAALEWQRVTPKTAGLRQRRLLQTIEAYRETGRAFDAAIAATDAYYAARYR